MSTDPQKPRVEVVQESTERLEVLELDRTPRPEKMARETAMLEGASEVAFHERAFRPRHPTHLDHLRERVDALEVRRRPLPDLPALPPLPLPPPPAPRPIPEHHRRALEPLVPAPLVAVEPVFSSEAGDVVAAVWEEGGERRSREFLVKDGKAAPLDDVSRQVDALPRPRPGAAGAAGADPAPAGPVKKPKRKFGFGKKD